jgi:hypothetical protein
VGRPIRGAIGVESQTPSRQSPKGVYAFRGPVAPQAAMEDSLMASTTQTDGTRQDSERSGAPEDSEHRLPKPEGLPKTASGAYVGLERQAVIASDPQYPEAQVVVMDRLVDPHSQEAVAENVPVLSQSDLDSQMQKAVSQAQKERSNPGSTPPESAEGGPATPEGRPTPGDTATPAPRSPTGPTGSTGNMPTGSTNPKQRDSR